MRASTADWKYAVGLDLDEPGFDASVLTEFGTGGWTSRLARLAQAVPAT